MNICILISSLNYGGSSQVVVDLACGLKSRGHAVTVVSLWNLNDGKYIELLNDKGIKIDSCNKKGKFDLLCYRRLKRIIKEGAFDLINTHLTSLFYCFLAKPAQCVVHTIHSIPELDVPKIYRILMRGWIRKHNVCFAGCSKNIADKASYCYKGSNVELITNGFNPPLSLNKNTVNKEYDFIYVGRLVSMKNIDEIIRCFSFINNKGDKKLCIVGEGPEESKLKQLCLNDNISNVWFVGGTDNVFDYLQKSRVFCLFSNFEGGPICLLEAMSCGLPVVCSNIEGNNTYVKDGENGLVFDLHDLDKAKNNMILLLEDKELYDKMSQEAYYTAKENGVDNMVKKYEFLFARLIDEQF